MHALQPSGSADEMPRALLSRFIPSSGDGVAPAESLSIDQQTFISLMVDKAVHDFAAGEKALLPAFEALDADGDGMVTQQQLLAVIDNFCSARPEADGCDIDHRPLKLAQVSRGHAHLGT